jgi:hypothetical protein
MAAIEVARHNARPPHRTAAAPPADYATRRGRHRSPGRTRRSLLPPGSGDRGGWRRRTVPGGRGRPRRVGRECCGCRRTPQQHCALLPRYGVGVCTPTGTPTSRVPRVSAAFRRCTRNTVTCGNRILAETGGPVAYILGQVVAGSNPVSPTREVAGQRQFRRNRGAPFSYPPGVWIATRIATAD